MTEAEKYLEKIPMWASKKNTLSDIRKFLERMGNPDRSMNVIHVAGTNGKGSVCAYLSSILKHAGYHTAVFISPHLIRVRERFLHDETQAAEEEFLRAFKKVKALSQVMAKEGYAWPSYFEFLFYMFMDMAKSWKPDVVILETGLGGLLDTTNVVEHPALTIITSVSMDHMQYLGNTIKEIAAQKAGILKSHVPVVYDAESRESRQIIEETAGRLQCPSYPVLREHLKLLERDEKGAHVVIKTGKETLKITVPSRADYQIMNAGLAAQAALVLGETEGFLISPKAVAEGIKAAYWPGRMEEVLPGVYLDGAHNAGGMEALTRTIADMQKESKKPAALMFGVVQDKEYHKMIEELCSRIKVSCVIVGQMDTKRSADAAVLAKEFRQRLSCPVEAFDTVQEAWECLLSRKGDGLAFCAGSLYLAGQVKALLNDKKESGNDD